MSENNAQTQLVETLLKILQKSGVDVSKIDPNVKIEFTKTIEITTTPKLALDVAMPYPIPPDKHYIDYFINDQLIETIRDFLQQLLAKQGVNTTLIYKMAAETPDTIMNNKEIIVQLERLAKENVNLANIFIHLHMYYNPSEAYKWLFTYGVSLLLEQCVLHYNRLSRKYKEEARFHGENILKAHEKNAEIDYWNLRSLLHGLENKVNMLSQMQSIMGAEEAYRVPRRLFETTSKPEPTEKKKKEG